MGWEKMKQIHRWVLFTGVCVGLFILLMSGVLGACLEVNVTLTHFNYRDSPSVTCAINKNDTVYVNLTLGNLTHGVNDLWSNYTMNYRLANVGNSSINLTPFEQINFTDGGCDTVPYDGFVAGSTQAYVFCPGSYYAPDSGDNGTIYTYASNVKMICNNTVIIGDNTSGSRGVAIGGGAFRNNVSMTGCTFRDFWYNAYIQRESNLTFSSNNLYDSKMESLYTTRVKQFNVNYNTINGTNLSNTVAHCYYLSQGNADTYWGNVSYNNISNCGGNSLSINSVLGHERVSNVTINNNKFVYAQHSINDFGCGDCIFTQNILGHNQLYALRLGHDATISNLSAFQNLYYNNTFIGGDVWGPITIRDNTTGNRIYNNTYAVRDINVRPDNTSFWMEEQSTVNFSLNINGNMATNNYILFQYAGVYRINMTDLGITIFNQRSQFPFNDVRINGVTVATDIDSYSTTLSVGDILSIGDYTPTASTNVQCHNAMTSLNEGLNDFILWFPIFIVCVIAVSIFAALNFDLEFKLIIPLVSGLILGGFIIGVGIMINAALC